MKKLFSYFFFIPMLIAMDKKALSDSPKNDFFIPPSPYKEEGGTKKINKKKLKRQRRIEKARKRREKIERRKEEKKQKEQFKEAKKLLDLFLSGKRKKIQKKVENTQSLNILTEDGKSIVNCILDNNKTEILRLLISLKKLDLAFADNEGRTPFIALLKRDDWKINDTFFTMFALLISYFNGKGAEEEYPLRGLSEDEIEKKKTIINMCDKQRLTALHWAVKNDIHDVIDILYKNGANIDANFELQGETPLDVATTARMKEKLVNLGATLRGEVGKSYDEEIVVKKMQIQQLEQQNSEGNRFTIQRLHIDIEELQNKKEDEVKLLTFPKLARQEKLLKSLEKGEPGKNTLRCKHWSERLIVPGDDKKKPPVCGSFPPTHPQPSFNVVRSKGSKDRSNSVIQPCNNPESKSEFPTSKAEFIKMAKEALQETPKYQSKSCSDIPRFIGFVPAKKHAKPKEPLAFHRTDCEKKKESEEVPNKQGLKSAIDNRQKVKPSSRMAMLKEKKENRNTYSIGSTMRGSKIILPPLPEPYLEDLQSTKQTKPRPIPQRSYSTRFVIERSPTPPNKETEPRLDRSTSFLPRGFRAMQQKEYN